MSSLSPTLSSLSYLQENGCFENPQLNLFQDILCNSQSERQNLSHSVGLWDVMPKYSISQQAMDSLRDENGLLGLLRREFHYRKSKYELVIQPALIETEAADGKINTTAFYPSANEELVEEVLRKFAAEQQCGFFDRRNDRGGVAFSVYELRRELKNRGHSRSFDEIKLSLHILAASHIKITLIDGESQQQKVFRMSSFFPDVVGVTKRDLKADPGARWIVVFHPLVARSIETSSYRQFNYAILMKHSMQLTRWLHRLLIDKYVFASIAKPFSVRFSTIERDSALISNYSRKRAGQDACRAAVKELKDNGVLSHFTSEKFVGARGKVHDIEFTLFPSQAFVKEVKAAGYRKKLSTP